MNRINILLIVFSLIFSNLRSQNIEKDTINKQKEFSFDKKLIQQLPYKNATYYGLLFSGITIDREFISRENYIAKNGQKIDNFIYNGIPVENFNYFPTIAIDKVEYNSINQRRYWNENSLNQFSFENVKQNKAEFKVDFNTTTPFHQYNQHAVEFSANLPLGSKEKSLKPILYLATRLSTASDPNPSAGNIYRIKESEKDNLIKTPFRISSYGDFYNNAYYLTDNAFEKIKTFDNTSQDYIYVLGDFFIPVTKKISFNLGNQSFLENKKLYNPQNSLYNAENNSQKISSNINTYAKANFEVLKNEDYTLSFDATIGYRKSASTIQNENFKDNFFQYGHVGKFDIKYEKDFRENSGIAPNGVNYNTFYQYTGSNKTTDLNIYPSTYNPGISYYNSFLLNENSFSATNNLLYNGDFPASYINQNMPGVVTDLYAKQEQEKVYAQFNTNFSIAFAKINIGATYEKQTQRAYSVRPNGLWESARNSINSHRSNIDSNFTLSYYDVNNDGLTDTVFDYQHICDLEHQSEFSKNLRQSLGLGINDVSWINIDGLNPNQLNISMFSPDELWNLVSYYGYDYTGKKSNANNDYYTHKENGVFTRNIKPYEPIIFNAYGNIEIKKFNITFNAGANFAYFDANQPVLEDPYCFYPTYKAGEVTQFGTHPSNIGDDYVVYVDESVSKIEYYRDGDNWYDSKGEQVDEKYFLINAKYPRAYVKSFNLTLKDYEAFKKILPQLYLQYDINEKLNLFTQYQSATKNPQYNNVYNPFSYYSISSYNSKGINNPALKPEIYSKYSFGLNFHYADILIKPSYNVTRYENMQIAKLYYAYPAGYLTITNDNKINTINSFELQALYTNSLYTGILASINYAYTDIVNKEYVSSIDGKFAKNIFNLNIGYDFGSRNNYRGIYIGDYQVLSDFTINLTKHYRSGYRYTSAVPYGNGSVYAYSLDTYNKEIKNFTYTDLQISKGFSFQKEKYKLEIYFLIHNLLNTKNILKVYPTNGSANDDGYLALPEAQSSINSNLSPSGYISQYSMNIDNPLHYDNPRICKIGFKFRF